LKQFAEWLSTISLSVFIQNHNAWVIPVVQSIHIVGIGVVLGSAFMIYLRLLGWAGMDQTPRQAVLRFGPWLTWGLWVMLATGILMVIGEPVRELVTFSFWLKMLLVAAMAVTASLLGRRLRREEPFAGSLKAVALVSFLVWVCIIILGRLIAYDHVWGSWSPASKA
jgi:hypothetical protein